METIIGGLAWSALDSAVWLNILLDATLKGVIILVGAGIVAAMLRRASAPTRHLVWFLALASVVVLPVLSLALPAWRLPILPATLSAVETGPADAAPVPLAPDPTPVPLSLPPAEFVETAAPSYLSPAPPSPEASPLLGPSTKAASTTHDWSTWVLLAWAMGAASVLAYLLVGTVGVWRIARRARPVEKKSPWAGIADALTRELHLKNRRMILESEGVAVPMMWGIFRPVVLLPTGAEDWPEERRRIVLLHELAHLRRRDCLTQTLAQLACAFYWFNPLVWVAARRLRVERERACDDHVLNAGLTATGYAAHLLEIARSARGLRCAAVAAVAMARPSQLEGRLLAILDSKRSRRALTRLTLAIALLAVASVVLPLGIIRPVARAAEKADTRTETAEGPKEFRVSLPNGVTVELVGVSYHPSEGQQWWRPDGDPLAEAPYDDTGVTVHPSEGQQAYEFAFHLPEVAKRDIGLALPGSSGTPYRTGKPVRELRAVVMAFPATQRHARFRLGIAMGAWHTLVSSAGGGIQAGSARGSVMPGGRYAVAFAEPIETADALILTVTHSLTTSMDCRIVLVDKEGAIHRGSISSASAGGLNQTTVRFDRMSLGQVKEFEFQVRPWQWVEFKNVSLKPGHKTDVKVSMEGPETASTPEPAANGAVRPVARAAEKLEDGLTEGATPASPWKATLPNGAIVQLVGVSYHPSEGQAWWRPDGSEIDEIHWRVENAGDPRPRVPRLSMRQIVLRCDGKAYHPKLNTFKFDGQAGALGGFDLFKGGEQLPEWYGLIEGFLPDQETATMSFAVSAGEYQTWRTRIANTEYGTFILGVVSSRDGKAAVTVSQDVSGCDMRVRAKLRKGGFSVGKIIEGHSHYGLAQVVHVFDGASAKDVERVELQTRPYQWVTFKNVSLKPGHKTDVKVSVEGLEAGSTPEPGEKAKKPAPAAAVGGTKAILSQKQYEEMLSRAILTAIPKEIEVSRLTFRDPSDSGEDRRWIHRLQEQGLADAKLIATFVASCDARMQTEALRVRLPRALKPVPILPEKIGVVKDVTVGDLALMPDRRGRRLAAEITVAVLSLDEVNELLAALEPTAIGAQVEEDFAAFLKQTAGERHPFPEKPSDLVIYRKLPGHRGIDEPLRFLPREKLLRALEAILAGKDEVNLASVFDTHLGSKEPSSDFRWQRVLTLTMDDAQRQYLKGLISAEGVPADGRRFCDFVMFVRRTRHREDIVGLLQNHDDGVNDFKKVAASVKEASPERRARLLKKIRTEWTSTRIAQVIAAIVCIRDEKDYRLLRDNWRRRTDATLPANASRSLALKSALERKLLAAIVENLKAVSARYSYISVMVTADLSAAKVNISNLRELRGINRRNVEVPIEGGLNVTYEGAGSWAVQGTGDLGHVEFTVATAEPAEEAKEQTSAAGEITFGPVIERVVSYDGAGKNSFIDFETGKVFSWPAEMDRRDGRAWKAWVVERGIDAEGDAHGESGGLSLVDSMATTPPREWWDDLPPMSLQDFRVRLMVASPLIMVPTKGLPATFAFGTREGGMGILQILGFTENPNGVKIRYKMIQEQPGVSAAELPVVRPVLSFEGPVYVNMPVWVYVQFPESKKFFSDQKNIRYPFTVEPWNFQTREFDVKRDDKLLPRIKVKPVVATMGGLVGGSVAPGTSPKYRLPLHLQYRFDQPGTYSIRYRQTGGKFRPGGEIVVESDWTRLEVRPFTDAQRRAWLRERQATAPGDVGLLIGDFLPSILAHPDEDVLQIILDHVHHPDSLVQKFTLNGFAYYGEETFRREILGLIKRKGPTDLLAHVISWRRKLFQSAGADIVEAAIPFLSSKSASEVGGAIKTLSFLRAHYSWDEHPNMRKRIKDAVFDAVDHVRTFDQPQALHPLCVFAGGVKSEKSRALLWELSLNPEVREQAYICITFAGDPEDLPKLAKLVLQGDERTWSLPYHLRRAYGAEAIPYLVRGLMESPNESVRLYCARALAFENHPQAFAFFREAIQRNRPYKNNVLQFLRDHFEIARDSSEDEILKFLAAKRRTAPNNATPPSLSTPEPAGAADAGTR